MNPLPPEHMSPKERLAEICGLLAKGLARLRARNLEAHHAAARPDHGAAASSSGLSRPSGESSLDFAGHPSGHATTKRGSQGR